MSTYMLSQFYRKYCAFESSFTGTVATQQKCLSIKFSPWRVGPGQNYNCIKTMKSWRKFLFLSVYFQRVELKLILFLHRRMSKSHVSFSLTDNSEIISRNGMECQESALRITKHCYCTYYPVSSSIELPQTAC